MSQVNQRQSFPPPRQQTSSPDGPIDFAQMQQQQEQSFQMEANERPPIFRPSRASLNLKNLPQPHMCIRDTTVDGHELFINVMSWTRIFMPEDPSEPIPLYGGMRVVSASPRSPPLVYAVMANPDVLKPTGRNCTDPQDRMDMVELMCEFVEAMNPGLKLARKPVVLPDRDLSGELKAVWSAVQTQRKLERDVSAMHDGGGSPKQTTTAGGTPTGSPTSSAIPAVDPSLVVYTELGPDSAPPYTNIQKSAINNESGPAPSLVSSSNSVSSSPEQTVHSTAVTTATITIPTATSVLSPVSTADTAPTTIIPTTITATTNAVVGQSSPNAAAATIAVAPVPPQQPVAEAAAAAVVTTAVVAPATSTKKEKALGSFLPNGCHSFFPVFKSKNQDRSSDKKKKEKNAEKESKTKEKNRSNSDKKKSFSKQSDTNKDTTIEGDLKRLELNRMGNEKEVAILRDEPPLHELAKAAAK